MQKWIMMRCTNCEALSPLYFANVDFRTGFFAYFVLSVVKEGPSPSLHQCLVLFLYFNTFVFVGELSTVFM